LLQGLVFFKKTAKMTASKAQVGQAALTPVVGTPKTNVQKAKLSSVFEAAPHLQASL